MFDWLVEGWAIVYVVLFLALVVGGAAAALTRDRRILAGVGGVVVLLVLYTLVDFLVETEDEAVARQLKTDRKQLATKTDEIADGLKDQNLDKVFSHVSEDFQYRGLNKKAMRRAGEGATKTYGLRDVKMWDVEIVLVDRARKRSVVHFNIKGKTNVTDGQYLLCKSEWVLDPDGEWRMKTFDLFNPVVDQNTPIDFGLR